MHLMNQIKVCDSPDDVSCCLEIVRVAKFWKKKMHCYLLYSKQGWLQSSLDLSAILKSYNDCLITRKELQNMDHACGAKLLLRDKFDIYNTLSQFHTVFLHCMQPEIYLKCTFIYAFTHLLRIIIFRKNEFTYMEDFVLKNF